MGRWAEDRVGGSGWRPHLVRGHASYRSRHRGAAAPLGLRPAPLPSAELSGAPRGPDTPQSGPVPFILTWNSPRWTSSAPSMSHMSCKAPQAAQPSPARPRSRRRGQGGAHLGALVQAAAQLLQALAGRAARRAPGEGALHVGGAVAQATLDAVALVQLVHLRGGGAGRAHIACGCSQPAEAEPPPAPALPPTAYDWRTIKTIGWTGEWITSSWLDFFDCQKQRWVVTAAHPRGSRE